MRTSSAARQFVAYPMRAILLVVGVLLLASVAPLWAEPTNVSSVNWFAPAYAAASVPRTGFLLPTLVAPATGAGPRLVVTEGAFRGAAPVRVSSAAGQDQTTPKPSKSWWSRNWLWVVVPVAILAGLAIAACSGAWDGQCN